MNTYELQYQQDNRIFREMAETEEELVRLVESISRGANITRIRAWRIDEEDGNQTVQPLRVQVIGQAVVIENQ